MPGKYQYDIELKSNVAKLLTDMKEVQDRLDTVEGKEYKIKLNVDEKKLSNVISNLEKMLDSLGKGTGDFKQFENLSKELSSITTDINNISKAFSVMNDGSDFANSIKSIDTSLTALSNHFVSEMSGRMVSSIKEVKSTLSDIGDGGELAPLLQTINKIENAINELSTSVKGIGLNIHIDVGSDSEMESKVQSKIANALQAYQRLFDHIKMSGAGGSVINTNFFEFDINQYDTMMGKLQAYKKFIDNMRKEAKTQFNGKDVLYQDTEKSYWTQASAAMGQVTKAFNETNAASDTSPLKDLFGGGDLSEVISQLGLIVAKLEEISTTASSFKNIFDNGFNVTASVEEIDKLTNRVKELEDELSKVKLNPVNVDKSNNLSGTQIKDVFQGGKIDQATTSAKELDKTLEQVDIPTDSFDDVLSKLDLTESKLKEIVKITKQSVSDSEGKFHDSYTLKDKRGSTEIYGLSSNTEKGQLLRSNIVEYDAKAAEQEAKALLEITKETEKQTQNQQKKWKEFQKEQADYVSNKQEIEAIERNKIAYQELLDTIQKYSEVSKRIAKNQTLDGDIELANKLEDKISELQKQPILSSSQIEKSERDLVNLYDKLEILEKQTQSKNAEQKAKAVKEEWDKNVKAIQDYMDAVTKLNNLNAKDKGTGKYASQIALQEKNVEELKEKALEARTAITSMINPHDVPLDTWNDYLDVMEKFDQASLGSAESVAKLEDALRKMDFSSLESAGAKFKSQYDNLSFKPDGDHQFSSWTNDLKELNAKIDEYNSKVKYLKENNIVDGEQVEEVKKLRNKIEETINIMTKTPQTKRGWTDIGASNAAEKVANILKQNTKMSKEARDAIRAYYNELRSGNPSQPIADILAKVNQLVQKERELGRVGKSFREIFKEKVIYGSAAQLAGMVGFYDLINVGREGFQTIRELDTALVDLKKTTAMNSSQLEEFYFDSNDVAKQMGATTQAIIDQASAWSRLGYNTKETSIEMAKLSSQFATISPGMDTDTAQEGLISIMKAWNIDVDDVKSEIMDNINALGNGMAENNQDIVEGMERSAAALASVGTSYEDAFAMFSGIQEVLQNAEVSGRALRSISMRIRGYDESTEELSSDLENITGELIDLTKTAEHTQGVSIFKEGSTTEFKSLVDYFGEINEAWDEMSQKQQNDFLQKAFGKTQAQAGAALIQNYKGVTKSLEIMGNAAGRYIARICSNTYLRIYLIAGNASIGQSYLLFI